LVLRVAQVKKAKDLFYQRATYKGSRSTGSQGSHCVHQGWSVATKGGREKEKKRKEKRKTKEGGLSPQEGDMKKRRKEKNNTKEGKKVAPAKARFRVPETKNPFFGS
jgi:hypothetical protein